MSLQRLDKLLTSQGLGTRSEMRKKIFCGHITVDGTVCRSPDQKCDPTEQTVLLDGQPLDYAEHLYIMMNKPAGLLCVSRDRNAETVVDLLPENWKKRAPFPAGRLDKDTVGLVLLTDDGEFAHNLVAPKKHVTKRYLARLDGSVDESFITAFAAGTTLADGTICLPAGLKILENSDNPLVEVLITQGIYHQIKRMFASLGRHVTWLKRCAIGGLELDDSLEEGAFRLLTEAEKLAIY